MITITQTTTSSILGRAPDTCMFGRGGTPTGDAIIRVSEEFGIAYDYRGRARWDGDHMVYTPAREAWADWKMFELPYRPESDVQRQDSIKKLYTYDPMKRFEEVVGDVIAQAPEGAIVLRNWHPGYVDYYVCEEDDHGPWAKNFLDCRCYDTHMLCSTELHDCIQKYGTELVNMRDAIRGTREYQNHLRSIGSDLAR